MNFEEMKKNCPWKHSVNIQGEKLVFCHPMSAGGQIQELDWSGMTCCNDLNCAFYYWLKNEEEEKEKVV